MNSLLDFIYISIFAPCDLFLYLFLAIVSLISLTIIFRSSRRITQNDPELPAPLPAPNTPHEPVQPPPQQYFDAPYDDYSELESGTAPSEVEDETQHNPSHSSETSTDTHNTTSPGVDPGPVLIIGSAEDQLRGAGSLFGNDNDHHSFHSYSSSPTFAAAEDESEGSTSSLDLNI